MNIRVRRVRTGVTLPAYARPGDAGMDIANAGPETVLAPGARALLPTGITVEIPAGYEIQVRPRSGLALKRGLTVLNSPGTIDSGYRGEVGIILCNLSAAPVTVAAGERIAQLVLARCETIVWEEADTLAASERSTGGFGSTG